MLYTLILPPLLRGPDIVSYEVCAKVGEREVDGINREWWALSIINCP